MAGEAAAPPTLGMPLVFGSKVNRSLPLRASTARNFPLPSPKKTTSPPIDRPDFAGRRTLLLQTILPVRVLVAPNNPKGCEPWARLVKAEPSGRPLGSGALVPLRGLALLGRGTWR